MSGNFSLKRADQGRQDVLPGNGAGRPPAGLRSSAPGSSPSPAAPRATARACAARSPAAAARPASTAAPRPSRSRSRTPSSSSSAGCARRRWAGSGRGPGPPARTSRARQPSRRSRAGVRSMGRYRSEAGRCPARASRERSRNSKGARRPPGLTSGRVTGSVTAAAASAAAPPAPAHGARPTDRSRARPLHADHREPTGDAIALARRDRPPAVATCMTSRTRALAGQAPVFVDRHVRLRLLGRARLLAAALDVALHELLGVLLEDVVDLVQEVVQIFLDLLALLGSSGFARRRRRHRPRWAWSASSPSSSVQPSDIHLLAPRPRARVQGLDRREHDPLLALVLPLPVRIGRLAGLV